MSRRKAIGFELPENPPAAPKSQRRSLKPARHHESQLSQLKADVCPTCGKASSHQSPVSRTRAGSWRQGAGDSRPASAGEDARPAPHGPFAPENEAVHASSRAMRRAGELRKGAGLEEFFRAQAAIPGREDSLAHMERIPSRESRFTMPEKALPESLRAAVAEGGVEELYMHQASSLDAARRGENVVVVTGTASGKTLCYNLPVFETLLEDDQATAFYLFPTKALAQDQLKGAQRLAEALPELGRFISGTYDGDTSTHTRRKLRMEGRLILTNPDMFHAGILPSHTRWARFFMNLRYVVLDEIHSYRGIFGSNVAAVMRRLRRICAHYGSNPVFIASSATIGNPKELAERIFGGPATLVNEDGSPRGEKLFVFWNPPKLDSKGGERRSANGEAKDILCDLVKQGRQTICFSKTKVSSELIYRYARDTLEREAPHLAPKLRAYRGGYLPEERREIERQLFSGELMAVSSTNALELGIDIGGLDAALMVGLPPTVASAWQQAGRAGRGERESCAVLVAHNDPVEQYLMRRPEFFFRQNPEKAVIDHANPFILLPQLRCAAYELPLEKKDNELFGELTDGIVDILEQRGELRKAGEQVFFASNGYPAGDVNLRQSVLDTVSIVQLPGESVIGNVDLLGACQLVYPEAIYLHEGETYFVRELDLDQKVAFVEQRGVDYYTQPITEQKIRLEEAQDSVAVTPGDAQTETLQLGFGDVTVSKTTFAFKKVKFGSLDSLGWGKLDLPWHHLETRAFWIALTEDSRNALKEGDHKLHEALAGLKNLILSALPFFAMCDRADLGGVVDASNLGTTALFVYDRFHGGLGYSRVGFDDLESVLTACLEMLESCACEDGCPACVGLPNKVPGQNEDPDLNPDFAVPGKEATQALLRILLGLPTAEKPERAVSQS